MCMYVCPSRLGMLIFCIRHVPVILELDSTPSRSIVVSSQPRQLNEHEYDKNDTRDDNAK